MASSEHSGAHMKHWFESVMPEQYEALVHALEPGFSMSSDPHAAATMGANVVFSSWLVCIGLIVFALLGRLSLNAIANKEEDTKYHADEKLSFRNVFELYVEGIIGLSDSMVGRKNTKIFFWFFGGLFMYIFTNNLLGLLPGAVSPSQSISNNLAMGLCVLVFFTIIGIQRQGAGFFKHMLGPIFRPDGSIIWAMAPLALLILPIELFSIFAVRPGSLSLRLAGNMNGDHAVLGIAYQFLEYVLPTIALMLGTFVSLVQAFVFTLLTIIYVVFSLEHDDHH